METSTNQYIQEYLSNDNPSADVTALAYYHRDLEHNLSFDEVFQKATEKLCLTKEKIDSYIRYGFKRYVNKEVEKYLKTNTTDNISFNYQEYYDNEIKKPYYQDTIKKYNTVLKYKENKDHLGFYQSLTLDDLCNLGF